jgi:hypothetical protein
MRLEFVLRFTRLNNLDPIPSWTGLANMRTSPRMVRAPDWADGITPSALSSRQSTPDG